jgi:hypothetical protein
MCVLSPTARQRRSIAAGQGPRGESSSMRLDACEPRLGWVPMAEAIRTRKPDGGSVEALGIGAAAGIPSQGIDSMDGKFGHPGASEK